MSEYEEWNRKLAEDFTVYAFSRRENLTRETTTREMAEDLSLAMDQLGIEKTVLLLQARRKLMLRSFSSLLREISGAFYMQYAKQAVILDNQRLIM